MQLHKVIHHLGLISLERLVSGAVDSLSSLAKELDKPTPAVDIVHGDIAFNSQFAEALKSSFMHIVRNSMDHGIEAPPEREAAGKPAQGRLRFACEDNNGAMELHINDDGRGLALHKLYEKGVANGVFSADSPPSAQAVADLIFHSGLSTAQTVSMVSGRGVGMDAVRAFLKEHGASVRIVLDSTPGTLSFTPFRFVISLPISTFSL
jgi:chemotaxis protein histidine kinase CheA